MIYFDNAATSFPKPQKVVKAVNGSFALYGANPGRSGYEAASVTAEKIYETRKLAANFFNISEPENIVFTHNCTYALNCVIKGLAKSQSHFVCSSLEHNAVARPLETLKLRGVADYSVATVEKSDEATVKNFEKLIRKNTVAFICTGASNVFGKKPPIKEIAWLAHKHGLLFVLDAAQIGGVDEIDCCRDEIDFICVAGHKGLFAPMAVGILGCNGKIQLETVCEGGTGNLSAVLTQPEALPERLESGTLSVPDIVGLNAGIGFVEKTSVKRIAAHENGIITEIYNNLKKMDNIILYTDFFSPSESFAPIISFNVQGLTSEETAALLAQKGVAVRAGYHCAPLAHKTYGTLDSGTVRISPGFFTTEKDVKILLNSLFEIAKTK